VTGALCGANLEGEEGFSMLLYELIWIPMIVVFALLGLAYKGAIGVGLDSFWTPFIIGHLIVLALVGFGAQILWYTIGQYRSRSNLWRGYWKWRVMQRDRRIERRLERRRLKEVGRSSL
jgi:hypothetical protein